VRLDTGEPLKKATVILWYRDGGEHSAFDVTDDQGHFQFDDLPPGSYGLTISRNGYAQVVYGQKKLGDPGAVLSLSAGQKMADLLFRLRRTATITGRVFDEDGEPIPDADVRAFQAFRRRGKREFGAVKGTSTNDLGEYRLFGLNPGRYYVGVSNQLSPNLSGLARSSPQTRNEGYLPTFYPNASDPLKAQTIMVNAGDEIPSVDIMMKPSHFVTVGGKVSSTIPGWQAANTTVTLIPRDYVLSETIRGLTTQPRNKDGGFEIRYVPPGSYYVTTWWREEERNEHYSTRRELEVGNSDMEGITLTISRGVDVGGHITWEGMPPREVQSIRVALRALDESHLLSGIPDYKVKSDGSFVIKNVPEGVYAPQVFTGSWDSFLKSVRYGTSNVTDSGFAVHPGSDASLELIMSSRAARVEGVVVNADSLPAAGVYVVLIPDVQHRDDNRKYGLETTDQNGKFTLRGIIPGSYTVFCWDSAEDFDWYDPDMVKPYEGRGIAVSVTEGDHKSVQLTVIERIKSPQASQ
jgi:hypothetical protein